MQKNNYILLAFILVWFNLLPSVAQEYYAVLQMNDGNEIDMSDFKFGVIPGKGLYGAVGKTIAGLDPERNGEEASFILPDTAKVYIEEFIALPNMIVCKSGNNVYYWPMQGKRVRSFQIDTRDFHIRNATDSTIFVLVNDKAFEMKPSRGKPLLQCQYENQKIQQYAPTKDGIYVITDRELLLQNDGILTLLVSMPETIQAANASDHGVLLGTKTALFYYASIGTLEVIEEQPIREILNDGDYLYVITDNSSIYRLQRQPKVQTSKKKAKK